jgi:hypothetical protein
MVAGQQAILVQMAAVWVAAVQVAAVQIEWAAVHSPELSALHSTTDN